MAVQEQQLLRVVGVDIVAGTALAVELRRWPSARRENALIPVHGYYSQGPESVRRAGQKSHRPELII